jgi:hypothetical protein
MGRSAEATRVRDTTRTACRVSRPDRERDTEAEGIGRIVTKASPSEGAGVVGFLEVPWSRVRSCADMN